MISKREAVFQPEFREDLRYWVEVDRKTALHAFSLIEAIMKEPFTGLGKPDPLKYLSPGVWSRRLTQEHRLVYLVRDDRIAFLQARHHDKRPPTSIKTNTSPPAKLSRFQQPHGGGATCQR